MRAFSTAGNRLGLDIGSSQVRICSDNQMILKEDSVAALDMEDSTARRFGTKAQAAILSAPERYRLVWVVKNGIMADYDMTRDMMRYFINKASGHSVSKPTIMAAVPCDISSVTCHALVDALIHAGAQKVYLIPSPAAAALGTGLTLDVPDTVLSIVIGRDVTNAGIYCSGGKVCEGNISFGGHTIDEEICRYLQDQYRLIIGESQAERLKSEWAQVTAAKEGRTFGIYGRRYEDGVQTAIEISETELAPVMQRILAPVVRMLKDLLRDVTPEMAEDLLNNGMLLSGGSALLSGLSDWLCEETNIPVTVPENPDDTVARGCWIALGKTGLLPLIVENGEKYYGGS